MQESFKLPPRQSPVAQTSKKVGQLQANLPVSRFQFKVATQMLASLGLVFRLQMRSRQAKLNARKPGIELAAFLIQGQGLGDFSPLHGLLALLPQRQGVARRGSRGLVGLAEDQKAGQ